MVVVAVAVAAAVVVVVAAAAVVVLVPVVVRVRVRGCIACAYERCGGGWCMDVMDSRRVPSPPTEQR